jgi:hypothetical protein
MTDEPFGSTDLAAETVGLRRKPPGLPGSGVIVVVRLARDAGS